MTQDFLASVSGYAHTTDTGFDLQVFDYRSHKRLGRWQPHTHDVHVLTSSNLQRLWTADFSGDLRVWHLPLGTPVARLTFASHVEAVAPFPDGHHAVIAVGDRNSSQCELTIVFVP